MRLDALEARFPSAPAPAPLLGTSDDLSTSPANPTSLLDKRTDFPVPHPDAKGRVRFWTHLSYKKYRNSKKLDQMNELQPAKKGPGRRSKGENTRFDYIETINGEPVSGERIDSMSDHARSLFQLIADAGLDPRTWKKKNAAVSSFFHRSMCAWFEELAFCEDNWKAEKFGSTLYSPWSPADGSSTPPQVLGKRQRLPDTGRAWTRQSSDEEVDDDDNIASENEGVPVAEVRQRMWVINFFSCKQRKLIGWEGAATAPRGPEPMLTVSGMKRSTR